MKKILFATFMLVASSNFALAETKWLGFKAGDGAIIFAYSGDWRLSGNPNPPISNASFQILNPAETGTPDSTNLGIIKFDLSDENAKIIAKKMKADFDLKDSNTLISQMGTMIVYPDKQRQRKNGWEIKSGKGLQSLHAYKDRKPTEYQIREAYKEIKGNALFVRAAWPKLPNNPPQYDEAMETNFSLLVNSIKYQKGKK